MAPMIEVTARRGLWQQLAHWPARRWLTAAVVAVATVVITAIPTAMIPNPLFSREIPTTLWAWPVLALTGVLTGLVAATYVARRDEAPRRDRAGRFGTAGAFVTFFAVGCPVCNKIVLIALGYSGALQWFAPVQPLLAAGAVLLLGWAFVMRVRREESCPVPVKA